MLSRTQIIKLVNDGKYSIVEISHVTGIHRDRLTEALSNPKTFTNFQRSLFNQAITIIDREEERWLRIFIKIATIPSKKYPFMDFRLATIEDGLLNFTDGNEIIAIMYSCYNDVQAKEFTNSISFKYDNGNRFYNILTGIKLSNFVKKFHSLHLGKLHH